MGEDNHQHCLDVIWMSAIRNILTRMSVFPRSVNASIGASGTILPLPEICIICVLESALMASSAVQLLGMMDSAALSTSRAAQIDHDLQHVAMMREEVKLFPTARTKENRGKATVDNERCVPYPSNLPGKEARGHHSRSFSFLTRAEWWHDLYCSAARRGRSYGIDSSDPKLPSVAQRNSIDDLDLPGTCIWDVVCSIIKLCKITTM